MSNPFHKLGGMQQKWINPLVKPYQHEIDSVDYLLQNGIYAVNGKYTAWRYADIAAFGCVILEHKYSRQHNDGSFLWRVKPRWHDNGIRGNIVMLCAEYDGRVERTFWDVNDAIFYLHNGELKKGIHYNPTKHAHATRDYGVSISRRMWREHIDRFDIIHDCLRNICTNMLTPENYHRYKLDFNNGNPAQEAEPVYTPIVQEQRQLSLL